MVATNLTNDGGDTAFVRIDINYPNLINVRHQGPIDLPFPALGEYTQEIAIDGDGEFAVVEWGSVGPVAIPKQVAFLHPMGTVTETFEWFPTNGYLPTTIRKEDDSNLIIGST